MPRIRSEGGVFRHNDLPVNQIDPACKSNQLWFDAAREALQLAVMVRNELGWDLPVAVAFSLNAAEPEPRSREDWEQQMDWTPPSLYLFEKGKEFWAEISFQVPNVAEYKAIKLDRAPFGTALGTAYLVQFLRTDTGERIRSFLVTVSFCWEQ
jgi:hypothetical protein